MSAAARPDTTVTWRDADARLTIQIAVEDRDDLLPALKGAVREARRIVKRSDVGAHDREWCSSAERITLDLSDEGT